MDVQNLLQTAASPAVDYAVRNSAEQQLKQAALEHFGPFMEMLAGIVSSDSGSPPEVRMLATLALKNELTAKNEAERNLKFARWESLSITEDQKTKVKNVSLTALTDTINGVASSAAQLVAAIATIELPLGKWPDLTALLVTMTSADKPSNVKKAALTTIGYICETANPADSKLEEQMNGFLTAIIQAAQKSEQDESVRVNAINALHNSLGYIKRNFERENERNLIMMAVCEATQNTGEELQSAAFGVLARIMYLYYEFMKPYMEQALFALTVEGMGSKFDGVQCMAIEFWNTVSEVEYEIQLVDDDVNSQRSFGFVRQAVGQVLPSILKLLIKEDEDQDEDEWNVNMAAGTCVELMAKAAGDAVFEIVMSFVGPMIQSPNWNEREAAVMAFGSSLDGPDREKLVSIVQNSLQPLANMIKDSSSSVRETVAWCLGRIADFVIAALDTPEMLQVLLQAVISGLEDESKIVTHCCWAIINISEQLNPIPYGDTSLLSPFYNYLFNALLQTSNRTNNEHSARTSAYEALSSLVIYAPNDALPAVFQCSSTCDERMRQSLQLQNQVVSIDDRQNVEELQINLLGLLTNIIRRIEEQISSACDNIMSLLGQFLSLKFPNSLVEDDIFIAIGAVAASLGPDFNKYVPDLLPFIVSALNETELSVSSTAIGLVTDITHALGDEIIPYVGGFMSELSKILVNFTAIRQEFIPPALSCIGDLASAAGPSGQFDAFVAGTEQFLNQIGTSTQFTPEATTEQQIHVTKVKESILDAHVGIVVGLRDEPAKIESFVPSIFAYLESLCNDPSMMALASPGFFRSLVGLIGDLAAMYPAQQFKQYFAAPWISSVISKVANDADEMTRDVGLYAMHEQKVQLS